MKKFLLIVAIFVVIIGGMFLFRRPDVVPADQLSKGTENVFIASSMATYHKPDDDTLRSTLSTISYQVTQHADTETPFTSPYAESTERGIYVDIVSGEPLFSSKDKFDSGTGWPSFVKPIEAGAVVFKNDTELGFSRIEVRSRYADSHLGHVFDDGPRDRGGKRYCMNGAALRFIPRADMERLGYGAFVSSL